MKFVACYLIAYIYRHQPDQPSQDDVPSPSKQSKVIIGIDIDLLNYTRTYAYSTNLIGIHYMKAHS